MDGAQNNSDNEPAWQFKPGETISPRTELPTPAAAPAPELPAVPPQSPPTPPAAMPAAPIPSQPPVPEPAPPVLPLEQSAPPAAEQLTAEAAPSQPAEAQQFTPVNQPQETWQNDPGDSISWTASEFVVHSKTAGWHVLFVGVALAVAVVVWLFTKDFVSPAVIVLAGVVLSIYAARKPRQLQYQLNSYGLSVGQKQYDFADFKAFSVIQDGALNSIVLTPTKRFAPLTTLYYDPADEERILNILGTFLPHKEGKLDAVDSLMSRIRF